MRLSILAATVTCSWVQAQGEAPTFRSDTNIVVIPAIVRDSDGKSVGGLGRDDFEVKEDGKLRPILRVDVEQRNRQGESGFPQQFDAYVFDDVHLAFRDFEHARTALESHLAGTLLAGRRVALLTTSGRVSAPFTDSRDVLLDAVRRIQRLPGSHTGTECPDIGYALAYRIVRQRDWSALAAVISQLARCNPGLPQGLARQIAQTEATRALEVGGAGVRGSLGVMQRLVDGMQKRPGRRNVILLSSGFHTLEEADREVLSNILSQAVRQRVAVSAVNAHGVHGTAFNSDPLAMGDREVAWAFRAAADGLAKAAAETGGTYIGNENDTVAALQRVAEPVEHVYFLFIRAASEPRAGQFHELDVKVTKRRGVVVQARAGFYDAAPLSATDEVRIALFSGSERQQLDVSLDAERTASGRLRIAASVGGPTFPLQDRNGRHVNSLAIAYGVFDRNGTPIGDAIRVADLSIDENGVRKLRSDGIRLGSEFDVPPGTYLIRIVVREAENGRMASVGRMISVAE